MACCRTAFSTRSSHCTYQCVLGWYLNWLVWAKDERVVDHVHDGCSADTVDAPSLLLAFLALNMVFVQRWHERTHVPIDTRVSVALSSCPYGRVLDNYDDILDS